MSFLRHLLKIYRKQPPASSARPEPPQPIAKRLVLAELQNALTRQFDAADALDSKLKQLLASASLILSIVTTLQVTTGIQQIGWIYLIGLATALILYAVLIIAVLRGLRPMAYYSPIPSKWDEIDERFFGEDEDSALNLLISNYLKYMEDNVKPLEHKASAVRRASFLLVLIVVSLLFMGLVGLGSNVVLPWESPLPVPISP